MSPESRPAARSLWWFLGFLVIVLLLYAPVVGGKPFVDDWIYVLENPGAHILRAFGELHPYVFYRPLALSITAALQLAGGGSPVPIHIFQFVIHAGLALLVARIALRLGISIYGAALAGVFVAVTQAAAGAVGSYDTISLSLATLLGTASLGFMVGARPRPIVAVSLFGVALLCKESSVGYLPLLLLASFRPGWRRALPMVGVLLLMAAAYVAWRAHLGGFAPASGDDRYNMSVGPGIVRNLAMLWFAALLPISSVDVFTAVTLRDMAGVLLGVGMAFLVFVLSTGGFARERKWRPVVLALVVASVAVSPVLLLNRVSEVYAYTMVPFLALLFGASVVRLASPGRARAIVPLVVGLVLLANAAAVRQKAVAMEDSGQRAERLLQDLVVEVSALPAGGTIVLRDPPFDEPDYSVFRRRDFMLVPDHALVERTGRNDVTFIRISAGVDSTLDDFAIDRELTVDADSHVVVISSP